MDDATLCSSSPLLIPPGFGPVGLFAVRVLMLADCGYVKRGMMADVTADHAAALELDGLAAVVGGAKIETATSYGVP